VLSNDSVSSAKLKAFGDLHPNLTYNVGIAEQNMVGMAAGMANAGKVPFVAAAGCFLTARAMEQIKNDLAYTHSNVKLCAVSTGLAYGALGGTHHSIEDIAWMRVIADMTVIVPADPVETEQAVRAIMDIDAPVYLRISRMGVPIVHESGYQFQIGKSVRLREGTDITLMACGTLVPRALQAADQLAESGIQARVINMATVKPIDREAIVAAAVETGGIVTAEEHSVYGGFGSAIAEVVVSTHPVPMRIIGVPGVFAPTGSAEFLFEYFGLTAQGIHDAALDILKGKAEA